MAESGAANLGVIIVAVEESGGGATHRDSLPVADLKFV